MPNKFRLIDLFCGCGGMSLGFNWQSMFNRPPLNPVYSNCDSATPVDFEIVLSNDNNEQAMWSYRKNFDPNGTHSIIEPIERLFENNNSIPKADVVIGGPPCQGFSLLNKNRDGDARRALWWWFMEVAERSEAKVIVMENVQQLLSSPEFDRIKERLQELNYKYLMAHVLNAADYGAPQIRRRAIIMASKHSPIALPLPTHYPANGHQKGTKGNRGERPFEWTTTKEAIDDLDPPQGTDLRNSESCTQRLHFGRNPTRISKERYSAVPPGGNRFDLQKNRPDITPPCWIKKKSGGTDLFGRLWWERPSVTIRTEFFKPEKGRYLHPDQDRPITHREAARLQSFPDSFEFCGSKIEIAKQIGNAVPPLLAYAIAVRVEQCLSNQTTLDDMASTKDAFRDLLNENIKDIWYGPQIEKTRPRTDQTRSCHSPNKLQKRIRKTRTSIKGARINPRTLPN